MFGLRMRVTVFALALLAFAIPLVLPSSAQAAVSINDEYTEILQKGIIFANICESPRPDTGADTCQCRGQGKCSLEDVVQVFVNVSFFILAISGSAALIAFVYGGLEWITSAGMPERVKRGKAALTGAVIGLGIVFGAYAFINLVVSVLKTGNPATQPLEDTIGDGAGNIIDTQ